MNNVKRIRNMQMKQKIDAHTSLSIRSVTHSTFRYTGTQRHSDLHLVSCEGQRIPTATRPHDNYHTGHRAMHSAHTAAARVAARPLTRAATARAARAAGRSESARREGKESDRHGRKRRSSRRSSHRSSSFDRTSGVPCKPVGERATSEQSVRVSRACERWLGWGPSHGGTHAWPRWLGTSGVGSLAPRLCGRAGAAGGCLREPHPASLAWPLRSG